MTAVALSFGAASCDSGSKTANHAADGWITAEDVTVGTEYQLGRAYVRKSDAFQYELFFRDGVVTSTADRLPQAITSAADPANGFQAGMPPEFAPAGAFYEVFARITPETDMEAFALAFGSPTVARPVFSVDSMIGVTEYYWALPDRYILGVVTQDSKVIEKLLIRGAIPAVWR